MTKRFDIIGAPFNHLGCVITKQNTVNGLRQAGQNTWVGLSNWIDVRNSRWDADIKDCGDVSPSSEVMGLLEAEQKVSALADYGDALCAAVLNSFYQGRIPITIGGDHSIAVGTLQAVMTFYQKQRDKKVAVIWVDAHADCNDKLDGNLHGKPLAMLMDKYPDKVWDIDPERVLKPQDIYYIGVRDVMPNEQRLISELGIRHYGMPSIDSLGINGVISSLMTELNDNYDHIYLSFDYDALDGSIYRACATPNVGGLSAREAIHLVYSVASSPKFIGADFVEYMPELDDNGVSKELMIKLIDAVWGFRT
ncbi:MULTISPECIES: arginase family protein [unclassified Agarivorans]|uniref:arginase family protein n=1 Tax=unclassified Agarivorans TaxID=2636026 RepID=UPI0026E45CD4|nr:MULTISPECIES: arginase family protein [unclassified Agarivorans]MDO6686429.1 arginase family protein [Agarivorans sp. 3_MG-2023]MDO6713731.1 arginase family protein [Agarivorans sp. 2_MG-2023]